MVLLTLTLGVFMCLRDLSLCGRKPTGDRDLQRKSLGRAATGELQPSSPTVCVPWKLTELQMLACNIWEALLALILWDSGTSQ